MSRVTVYIAARAEDQSAAVECRRQLAVFGIGCSARWLDLSLVNESHSEAQMDIDDVRAADAFVLLKPAASHRVTTGGHHVETGIALERGMPILLLGVAENVFHRHDQVYVLPWPPAWELIPGLLNAMLTSGAPLPAARVDSGAAK